MVSGDVHAQRIADVPGRISIQGLKFSNATVVQPPSVAMALAGQGKTRGTVALVVTALSANQSVALIKDKSNEVNESYLFHNLSYRYEELRSRSAGGGRAGLSKGIIELIPLPMPRAAEQVEIGRVLDLIDKAIALTEALIAKQQRIKTALMQDLLTRGIDEHGNLRSEETHAFKESPLGRIPVEWEVAQLDSVVARKEYGLSSSLNDDPGQIPVLRMNNLVNGEVDLSDLRYASAEDTRRYMLTADDVLFNRTNSMEYVGRTGIFRGSDRPISFASYLVRLVVDQEVMIPEFLNLLLNLEANHIRAKRFATVGVQQANINPTNLGKVQIVFPQSVDEQQCIVNSLGSAVAAIQAMKNELCKLRRHKTALMQDLLTGKVSVQPLLDAEAAEAAEP
jgi:type I restriction enzyme, S subunit